LAVRLRPPRLGTSPSVDFGGSAGEVVGTDEGVTRGLVGGLDGGLGGGGGGAATGAAAIGNPAGAGFGAAGAGAGVGAVAAGGWWACVAAGLGRGGIGTNSPGRHMCGALRTEGSFRKRSACPHARQIRVPRDNSPRDRSEREPEPRLPVFRSLAQTKSLAPQLLHTGATMVPRQCEPT
jgi:hypothetical protein